jgi:nucleotide-binding universal stress UspA family protein
MLYSEYARAVYETALDLAARLGASIDLVHVWSAPYFGPDYGYENKAVLDPVQHASLFDLIRRHAVDEMQRFAAASAVPEGVRMTTHVESGDPVRKILEIAERERVDLLVIGTHGPTGARRWLLGSVAERIVRHAPCAVLRVPPPEA